MFLSIKKHLVTMTLFRKVQNNVKYLICNEKTFTINQRTFASSKSEKKCLPITFYSTEGRYATCLHNAAEKMGTLNQTIEDMKRIKNDLKSPNALTLLTTDPLMKKSTKAKLLKEAAKTAGMAETTVRFLGVLAENNRLKKLKGIVGKFHELMSAVRGEVSATVTVASALSDEQKKNLQGSLKKFLKSNQKLELEIKIDPSIIGGMVVIIGDILVDMSTANKIKYYKKLLEAPLY